MRIYGISDIHIDYRENKKWLNSLSCYDYTNDVIILAGDISDDLRLIEQAFKVLSNRFLEVFYVPGNHDLWVRFEKKIDSFIKFKEIKLLANYYGVHMKPYSFKELSIVPLYSWYDYTFGEPSKELINSWTDFTACKWPFNYDVKSVNNYFNSINDEFIKVSNRKIISFSHFLPSIELMPSFIPKDKRFIYPVLGSTLLMKYIKQLGSSIHIYGHSHVNVHIVKDNVLYINNAFGYPYETSITAKKLKCVYEI